MMGERKDGGPAFPERYLPNSESLSHPGMTLRDWFAGQALAGLASNPRSPDYQFSLARDAYHFADAMLKARGSDT